MPRSVLAAAAIGLVSAVAAAGGEDLDRDGLDDALEQALLERFVPRFWLDASECAARPAEFRPGSLTPRVRERNGTIYGRVSPSGVLGERAGLELHYYHLWDRDCGRLSPHTLDVEHVSALVVPGLEGWTARYWYAAAHEDTVCDTSNAARADAIGAATSGPSVWVSGGKHASYLSYELCSQRGCGVDGCGEMVALARGAIVNLGEGGHPLNGSTWIASRRWPLSDKLGLDFGPELVAALDASDEPVLARVNGRWRPAQFSLSVGSDVLGALGTAGRHGGGSVVKAEEETHGALGTAFRAVGRALVHVARALGLARSGEEP